MSTVKGQVILVMVFALTFALFSIFMLLAPIKDKLLRIKDMESVYQAITNSEKGLEATLLDVFKDYNLDLHKQQTIYDTQNCSGLSQNGLTGICFQTVYEPIFDSLWKQEDKFIANNYVFVVIDHDGDVLKKEKIISDGFRGKNIRTSFIVNVR